MNSLFFSSTIKLKHRHKPPKLRRLIIQALTRRCRFFHHGGVLLGACIKLGYGFVDLVNTVNKIFADNDCWIMFILIMAFPSWFDWWLVYVLS
jgi:hypothetical protein